MVNVAYTIPPADARFWRACVGALPPFVPIEDEQIRFRTPADSTADSESTSAVLPAGFGAALFDPSPEGGRLLLDFDESTPSFSLRDEDDEPLPVAPVVAWTKKRAPSYLMVHWTDGAVARESVWVVNVTDPSRLPPPDELRDLSLAALVEVLTTSRPFYEAVVRAIERQANRAARDRALELDPHRRVDTSGFLLKRVHRVSRALEGLRERLEKPALSIDALRWRLRGPVGPLALARRLVDEGDVAAVFLIAEIALIVSAVSTHHPDDEVVRQEVDGVMSELRAMLDASTDAGDVAQYAHRTFEEIGLP